MLVARNCACSLVGSVLLHLLVVPTAVELGSLGLPEVLLSPFAVEDVLLRGG